MCIIRKVDEVQLLREVFERLFISDDPFRWPFAERIESGLLLYPTAGYHLSETQYNAMLAASRATGDKGFIVSIVEGEGDLIARGEHWWCKYPSYKEYLSLPLVLENAVYSRNGLWGILISHEDHAIAGGSAPFIEKLVASYPEWEADAQRLAEAWKDNPRGSWISSLASNAKFHRAYGPK